MADHLQRVSRRRDAALWLKLFILTDPLAVPLGGLVGGILYVIGLFVLVAIFG